MTLQHISEVQEALQEAQQEITSLKKKLRVSNESAKEAESRLFISDYEILKNDQIVLKHHTSNLILIELH